jgi:outer membrane protein OmpA-like peptidoglycan-associated protein
MSDDKDDSTRTGLWAIAGIVALVVFGIVAGVVFRQFSNKNAPAAPTAAAEEAMVEGPLSGELLGAIFFESGKATVEGEPAELAKTIAALKEQAGKGVVLAGFHDATGDPVKNAELAKERAKAVRAALVIGGIGVERAKLRKPEQTDGGADLQAARRVEIRLVDLKN